MSENSKKSKFGEAFKNTKISRAALITSVIVVAALGIVISVTVASNRSKNNKLPDPVDTNPVTEPVVDEPIDTSEPTDTEPEQPPVDTGSSQVENKLPSFILPVSGSLSKKHDPTLQVYSTTMNDYRVHLGVDIVTEASAPVYAAADGTVSKIWKDPLMGYCIAVQHSGNCLTIYKNLAEELPDGMAEGIKVRSGQLLASVGESAMIEIAEEPHLHFEMTVGDLPVDPLEYFNEKALESLSIDASFGE
ncbi:MAG: M23 family metallopeptidase [Clostridia bacterium]|nr:M23 family metallopeptidase [Clostridia bacterium]